MYFLSLFAFLSFFHFLFILFFIIFLIKNPKKVVNFHYSFPHVIQNILIFQPFLICGFIFILILIAYFLYFFTFSSYFFILFSQFNIYFSLFSIFDSILYSYFIHSSFFIEISTFFTCAVNKQFRLYFIHLHNLIIEFLLFTIFIYTSLNHP